MLLKISGRPCWQPFGNSICRVETTEKIVALTFDDGPTPRGLDTILPVLAEHGVRATFFVNGDAIRENPAMVARLIEAGHEIGNHGYSHIRLIFRSPAEIERQIVDTDRLLRRQGVKTKLFRPPYFKRLYLLPRLLEREGVLSITADVADDAGSTQPPATYAADMAARARPGSILLVHAMFGANAVQRQALPLLLDDLQRRGYRVAPVGALLSHHTPATAGEIISRRAPEGASRAGLPPPG